MSIRLSYAASRLASVQVAALRLRLMFPEILVIITEQELELKRVSADAYVRVLQAAAAELIGASGNCLQTETVSPYGPMARAA